MLLTEPALQKLNMEQPLRHISATEIQGFEKLFRANLINGLSGLKPANLIGTAASDGQTNLAIFSSVVHLGSDPALLGFIQRPLGDQSHTYKNIKETGFYTINHVHAWFAEQAHYTSARFAREESEFDACCLTPEYWGEFRAPFVKESQVKIGMRFLQEIPLTINNTILMIGQIEHIIIPEDLLTEQGNISLDSAANVCVTGLDTYYRVSKLAQFPYAKTSQLPIFGIKTDENI
jgi:flavin reductase (DIM6/NTAB) family NADH-FMN oxidoreductase RutF